MSSLRVSIILAASASLLISCGSKRDTAWLEAASSGAVTQKMARSTIVPRFYVDQIGPVSHPVSETEIVVPSAGPLVVWGWAADSEGGLAAGVEITVDGQPFPATYGVDRKDVVTALQNPAYKNSGFQFSIPANQLSNGTHTVTVRIINKQRTAYFETPAFHIRVQ